MMKKLIVMTVVSCAALAVRTAAGSAEARFDGGSFDGWDQVATARSVGLGGALVTLSSGAPQVFDFTAAAALAAVVIWAEEPQGTITNGGVIRLSVPAAWACRFDEGAVVALASNAAAKVDAPYYEAGGRALAIPVKADFTDGDTLAVSGLRLTGLRLVPPGEAPLELDFDGDGERDVNDIYSLAVRALWPGGHLDGWDTVALALSVGIAPPPRGTLIKVE
jgi:hypothetical protein